MQNKKYAWLNKVKKRAIRGTIFVYDIFTHTYQKYILNSVVKLWFTYTFPYILAEGNGMHHQIQRRVFENIGA